MLDQILRLVRLEHTRVDQHAAHNVGVNVRGRSSIFDVALAAVMGHLRGDSE